MIDCVIVAAGASSASIARFGAFEADLRSCELRKRGVRIKIQEQPFRVLTMLLQEPGAVVTREEIRRALWAEDIFVDFEKSLNSVVAKLRVALGDTAENPRFVETIPRRGYRFAAPVTFEAASEEPTVDVETTVPITNGYSAPTDSSAWVKSNSGRPISNVPGARWGGRTLPFAIGAILIVFALAYLLFRAVRPTHRTDVLQFSRVTSSGDTRRAVISPDGKFVAFIRYANGKQDLWLKQLATDRDLHIASLGEDRCPGLAFSADGAYIYFVRQVPGQANGDLYKVPALAGTAKQVLTGINGPPALSPDGRYVTFVRSTIHTQGDDSIVIASLTDLSEKVVATYKPPGIHLSRIAWSPDGKKLVYVAQGILTSISVDGRDATPLDNEEWLDIEDLGTLPYSGDILIAGHRRGRSQISQIYRVPLDGSEIGQVTNDLFQYMSVRATADGQTLLAVQEQSLSHIEVAAPGESVARRLSTQDKNRDGQNGLAWTADDRIVYEADSNAGDRVDLWITGVNDATPQRLTSDRVDTATSDPASYGGFVAFSLWTQNDHANIWRVDMDGGHLTRLTQGRQDYPPSISPDGKWIVFGSIQGDKNVLMKVPSDGGPVSQLTYYPSFRPSISPDGQWIACAYVTGPSQPASLAIVPFTGGRPVKSFPLPATAYNMARLVWRPDNSAVSFVNNVDGVSNIWEQPVAGGPPRQVTNFTSDKIFYFDWSRHNRLALSRGAEPVDAVLIRNFR